MSRRRKRRPCRPPAARRGGHPSDLPARARGDQAGSLAGRGLRRGGQGAARGSGRGRGGDPRSQARAARARRLQEARSRDARKALRQDLRQRRGRGRHRAALRASIATTSCAPRCGRWRARWRHCRSGRKLVFVDGRDRIETCCDCQAVISGDAIIASIAAASIVAKVTRDRLMVRLGARLSGLWLRASQGLQRARAFRRAGAARPDHPSPPLLRPGGRPLWRVGARDRRHRAELVASLAPGPYSCRSGLSNQPGPMLYVSIFVELLRSRPALAVWLAALVQGLLWTLIPTFFYAGPPGDVPQRARDRARVPARHLSGPAARVLAGRGRLRPHRSQPVRRLPPVAGLRRRHLLGGVHARPLDRRRATCRARGAAHGGRLRVRGADARLRAGHSHHAALGGDPAALLAGGRRGPARTTGWCSRSRSACCCSPPMRA